MSLVIKLDKYKMQEIFAECERDYYSLEGYEAILDLFEDCDCGKDTDLDVVAICCDFSECDPYDLINNYDNIDEIAECYNGGDIDTEKLLCALNNHTWAVELANGNILIQNF